MTLTEPTAEPARGPDEIDEDAPIGVLVKELKEDLARLLAEQRAIAKVELKREAGKAGTAIGMFLTALFALYMVLMFGSLAAVYGLGHLVGNGWAALIVTGAWLLGAVLTALVGRSTLRRMTGPQQTVAALKENLEWLRSLKK
jgi:putative superfamily III holin-X